MNLLQSESYLNRASCIELHSTGRTNLSSEINMQTTTSVNSSEVVRNPYVVRISRPRTRNRSQQQHVGPSAAMFKPQSKWTVVAALILAVALHAGAVAWVEMKQAKPTLEADAPVLINAGEDFKTDTGTVTTKLPEKSQPIDPSIARTGDLHYAHIQS